MRTAIAGLVAFGVLGAACRRAPGAGQDLGPTPSPVGTPPASAAPPDHLAPDELVEGPGRAFGLPLPRVLEVKGSFVDVVYAGAPVPVHALTDYFRARLEDGRMREGPMVTTFEHVRVRGQPGRELLVRIAAGPGGARVEIRDSTPRPAAALPDEPARWRQAGLTPEGRLADPTHLD